MRALSHNPGLFLAGHRPGAPGSGLAWHGLMSGTSIPGLLLAGGGSRRMGHAGGGDKCLMTLGGRTLLDRAIERAAPQVGRLVLNANGDAARFASFGLPVVADSLGEGLGPLAGVLTGLDWAAEQAPAIGHLATFATDTPFFPRDLVQRLALAIERGADLACAGCGGRLQPVFGLWPVALRHELRRALVKEGVRRVDRWTARYRLSVVDFPAESFDPFFNLNEPGDLVAAERLAVRHDSWCQPVA